MKMRSTYVLMVVLLSSFISADQVSYKGYKVFRVDVNDPSQSEFLRDLERNDRYDFWTEVRKVGPVDVMASPQEQEGLMELLTSTGIEYTVMIEDVQTLVEQSLIPAKEQSPRQGHNMDWESYHPLEDMYGYFDYLEGIV